MANPAVIQGIQSGSLRPGILQRIWLKRQGSDSKSLLGVAPITTVPTLSGYYHYWNENGTINSGGAADPLIAKTLDQPATPGGLALTSAAYNVLNYAWGGQVIPNETVQEFAARGEDVIAAFTEKLATQGVQHHAKSVGTLINTSGSYSDSAISGPALATTPSGDLIGAVNTALLGFIANGVSITDEADDFVAVINTTTYATIVKAYQIKEYGAIAAISGPSTFVTGYSDRGAVERFFRNAFMRPIRLVVSDHTTQTMTGTVTNVITDGYMSIFKVARGQGDSGFLSTFTTDSAGATGRVITYPMYNPQGTGIYVKGLYGVTVLGGSSKFARLITGLTA
jgi:hypothetical protein